MRAYAKPKSVYFGRVLPVDYPQATAEAIHDGSLTVEEVERSRNFQEGVSSQREVSKVIDAILSHRQKWDYRWHTAQGIISEAAYRYAIERGFSSLSRRHNDDILIYVERHVGRLQTGPVEKLHFGVKGNLKNRDDAEAAFKATLGNVRDSVNEMLQNGKDRNEPDSGGDPTPTPTPMPVPEPTPEPEPDFEPDFDPEPEPEPDNDERISREARDLKGWFRDMHVYFADQAILRPDDRPDQVSIRSFENSAQLLKQGMPARAIKAAYLTGHNDSLKRTVWNFSGDYVRQHPDEINEWDFDPQTFVARPDIPGMRTFSANPERYHNTMQYWLTENHAVGQGYVYGPTGSGKTTLIKDGAHCIRTDFDMSEEEFPFGLISLNRGTPPSAFNGRPMISNTSIVVEMMEATANKDADRAREISARAAKQGDVVISMWQLIIRNGGIVLLDEADAADENLILTVNAVMANGLFYNTATGALTHRHPNCSIWMAGNTPGTGASGSYNARNKMDDALIDRVRLSRFKVEMDLNLAMRQFDNIMLAD